MNLKSTGSLFTKSTKNNIWWMKLGIGLILSNIFFFLLFSDHSETKQVESVPEGWVEIELEAQLLTPFQLGKKVLLIHRHGRKKIPAVLQLAPTESGRLTVMVKENETHLLLHHQNWEVLPFLKNLNFAAALKESSHEIHY